MFEPRPEIRMPILVLGWLVWHPEFQFGRAQTPPPTDGTAGSQCYFNLTSCSPSTTRPISKHSEPCSDRCELIDCRCSVVQTITMPAPILNVRYISAWETLPSLCISLKTGNTGQLPCIDLNRCTLRQNPRNVIRQSSSGNMRESFYYSRIK